MYNLLLTDLKDICRNADVLFLYSKKLEKMHKWWVFDHKLH
ncbi:hypothetical protein HMPREF1547_02566 [Blautia sp. KLE 1732]|nr:hypothetical protein HMPREF1547_02566 [Blautia sp. KLE 1732]